MAGFRDVTERRRAEEELHEAKDLFESAFSAAPIGMTLVGLTPDTAGRVLQVNAALCELLGYPADTGRTTHAYPVCSG